MDEGWSHDYGVTERMDRNSRPSFEILNAIAVATACLRDEHSCDVATDNAKCFKQSSGQRRHSEQIKSANIPTFPTSVKHERTCLRAAMSECVFVPQCETFCFFSACRNANDV